MTGQREHEAVMLDQIDVEVALAVHGLRDHDEQWVRPGEVFKKGGPWLRRALPSVQAVAKRMRTMAERGILERAHHVKHAAYREEIGVVAAIDDARPLRVMVKS